MVKAGGLKDGILNVAQIHTYANKLGVFHTGSPFNNTAVDYQLQLPMIIGETSVTLAHNTNWTIQNMYRYSLQSGYSGLWDWALVNGKEDGNDGSTIVLEGINALKDDDDVKVQIL